MKDVGTTTEVSRIVFEILSYLSDHPDANDTIEGIAQWWLLEQQVKQQVPLIEKALAELVDKGFVFQQGGSNGRRRYRINRRQLGQIKAFLEQKRNESD